MSNSTKMIMTYEISPYGKLELREFPIFVNVHDIIRYKFMWGFIYKLNDYWEIKEYLTGHAPFGWVGDRDKQKAINEVKELIDSQKDEIIYFQKISEFIEKWGIKNQPFEETKIPLYYFDYKNIIDKIKPVKKEMEKEKDNLSIFNIFENL